MNPNWNSEWFRFDVDDLELQDEPLQIRIMDYDTYSANDAIGKVGIPHFLGRVYFASISDIQLDVPPSKKFWMQNRTKALELYYFPSGWMSPLDVQNGCALEH